MGVAEVTNYGTSFVGVSPKNKDISKDKTTAISGIIIALHSQYRSDVPYLNTILLFENNLEE